MKLHLVHATLLCAGHVSLSQHMAANLIESKLEQGQISMTPCDGCVMQLAGPGQHDSM
jgi:hypothetical protein